MRILAIDLGTKTGWALFDSGVITSGTWVLAKPKEITQLRSNDLDRCCDFRPTRLREKIDELWPLDLIVFEDVQFATSLLQVQLWSSLRSVIWLASARCKVKAVDVGTLKKFATGKGNADKEHMAQAAIKAGFSLTKLEADDNEIDAWHLLRLALKDLENGTSLQT